jgi:hypothetical protein
MPPSHVNLHPTPSPKISNVPPGYKCYHNLNSDHAYGALSFAQASLNAHLCPKFVSKKCLHYRIYTQLRIHLHHICLYLRPTIKNPDETLYALCNLLKNDAQTTIFCVDTNVKNKLWGTSQTDSKGRGVRYHS